MSVYCTPYLSAHHMCVMHMHLSFTVQYSKISITAVIVSTMYPSTQLDGRMKWVKKFEQF